MSEEPKKEECPKKECPKEGCFDFHGFHGFGPRCHGPGMHPHKHKERKCECGEIIPKRKEGEPKIKVCPKCGKDLPKKEHGFGMRCRKMRKWMRFMHMMGMMNGPCGFGFGPGHHRFGPPPPPHHGGLEVHHYIHFGPPRHPPMGPPGFGDLLWDLQDLDGEDLLVHRDMDLVDLQWDLLDLDGEDLLVLQALDLEDLQWDHQNLVWDLIFHLLLIHMDLMGLMDHMDHMDQKK